MLMLTSGEGIYSDQQTKHRKAFRWLKYKEISGYSDHKIDQMLKEKITTTEDDLPGALK